MVNQRCIPSACASLLPFILSANLMNQPAERRRPMQEVTNQIPGQRADQVQIGWGKRSGQDGQACLQTGHRCCVISLQKREWSGPTVGYSYSAETDRKAESDGQNSDCSMTCTNTERNSFLKFYIQKKSAALTLFRCRSACLRCLQNDTDFGEWSGVMGSQR